MENWKTRANGVTALHVSEWGVHQWVEGQPPGTVVKIYKRGPHGWQPHETVTAKGS